MNYYGIDLGTSNCLVAKITQNLDDTFDVKCLSDNNGEESFPSVVYFEDEKNYKVGNSALQKLYEKPDSTIELIKIRLGKTSKVKIKSGNIEFDKSPQEISSLLLKHFNIIHSEKIENTIITVPAFFDQNQKDATMQAGKIAGMNPQSLIEEPTAAIMYHIFSQYKQNGNNFMGISSKNILVFDFGGGTLDLSLIEMKKNSDDVIEPKVLAIGGDEELGGNNIDFIFTHVVLEHLLKKNENDPFIKETYEAFDSYYTTYKEEHKLRFPDNTSSEIKSFIFRLKRNVEQIKIKLSSEENARIILEGKYNPIKISREQFEDKVLMNRDINIKERIKASLNRISKHRIPVNEVLLIGGSSQIPFVKNIILETFEEMEMKKEHIILSDDFDKAVAKGAAIQAAISSGVAIPPFMHNKCESIVARDIELEHAGNSKLFIPMGTEYPFKERKQYSLKIGHALSETVSLKLNEIIDENNKRQICNFEFFLPVYYTDDLIEISMDIDEAGLYRIEAIHDNTKETVEFEPNKNHSLTKKQLNSAVESSNKMMDIS